VKTTRYFDLQVRRNRPEITVEMCEYVVNHAEEVREQLNGYFQMWAFVESADHYLRVITTEDKSTLHNAFFDRAYARRKRGVK
jgi:hypothetical protein